MLRKIILILLVILSSILTILAFPNFDYNYLAFFSLVPLFILLIKSQSKKSAVIISFISGFLINLGFFYWIFPTFLTAKVGYFVAFFAYFLICLYFSVYWIIFGYVFYLQKFEYFKLKSALFLSAFFVILEYLRTYLLTGFPWNLFGYSQWNNLYFIQSVDILGIYWISFLIILINIFITTLVLKNYSKKLNLFVIFIVVLNLIYGYIRLNQDFVDTDKTIKFSVLQGNIDQYKKFDGDFFKHIRDEYLSLVEESRIYEPDILVWPETSYPHPYPMGLAGFFQDVRLDSYQIVGAFCCNNKGDFNSAVLLDKDLNEIDVYSKNHLVLFGEFFPFKYFIEKFVPSIENFGDVSRGEGYFPIKFGEFKIGTSICFESLFGNEIRRIVLNGADILVNMSNDGWYLDTSAPYQHFSFNIFRAIENRRFLVRSANTGISAVISPKGEILARTEIYEKAILNYKVPIVKQNTIYTRFGDWFVWICIIFFLLILFFKKI